MQERTDLELILDAVIYEITPNTNTLYADDILTPLHHHLLTLINERLADEPDKQAMVERYQEDPAVWEGVFVDALQQAGIDEDDEIIEAARELLQNAEQIDPEEELLDHPDALELPSSIPGVLYEEDEEE